MTLHDTRPDTALYCTTLYCMILNLHMEALT